VCQLVLVGRNLHSTPSWHHDAGDVAAEVLLQADRHGGSWTSEPVSIVAIRLTTHAAKTFRSARPPARLAAIRHAAGIGMNRARRMASIRGRN